MFSRAEVIVDVNRFFLAEHARVHARAMTQADFNEEDTVCDGLTEAQLRHAPEGLNSIVWLLWHLARCEDVAMNTVLRGVPEVLDHDHWLPRLGVETRHIGTGATREEVIAFSQRVDVTALRAYRAAVGRATQVWVAELDFATLATVPDVAGRLAQAPPAFGAHAGWVAAAWARQTGSWFLSYLAVGHNYWHLGEAYVIRGYLGAPQT